MKKIFFLSIILLISLFIFSCSSSPEQDIKDLIPKSNEIQGWVQLDEAETFQGEALYEYINGGAEIFHEYGFREVIVQEFSDADNNSIMLEIFEMNNDEAAYGIYSFRRDKSGELYDIGNGAILSSSYMFLWKGNYYIVIYSFTPGFTEPLISFAETVTGKINESGKIPGIMSALPEEGLVPASQKLLKGPIAFSNRLSLSSRDIFNVAVSTAIAYAEYSFKNNDIELFLINYDNEPAKEEQIEKIIETGKNDESFSVLRAQDPLVLKDNNNNFITTAFSTKRLILVISKDEKLNSEFLQLVDLPEK